MQLCAVNFISCSVTLHVLVAFHTHHQEYFNCITASATGYTHTSVQLPYSNGPSLNSATLDEGSCTIIQNTSVKHNSKICILHRYVFQFLSNHHKAIHTKYLKKFTLRSVTNNTKNSLVSNIFKYKDSLRIETCINVVGLLLN